MTELSLRDQLIADYEEYEDQIEQAAIVELWALGDWLAQYVPNGEPGPKTSSSTRVLELRDLVGRRGRSQAWLNSLRKVARTTAVDRLPQITPRVYIEALRKNGWDLMAANDSLVNRGHRLRDQAGPMESMRAIKRQLDKRPPEERAKLIADLAEDDPTVADLLGDLPVASFGAEWADRLVLRIHTNAEALSDLVRREGLRFAPSTPLDEMLGYLSEAELRIAELRAAVQERIQDRAIASDEEAHDAR